MEHPIHEQYLLDYLIDEFRSYPEIRIRLSPFAGEPEISVKTESREYSFPVEWMKQKKMKEIDLQIKAIKDALPDR